MRLRSVLLAGIVVLAAGCAWPMAGQSPDRSGWARDDTTVTPADVDRLAAGWIAPVPSPTTEIVGDRDLLVVRSGTDVDGVDAVTGEVRWTRWLPGTGTPGVRDDFVYLPSSEPRCAIVQADRGTGTTAGRLELGRSFGAGATSICAAGDVVVDGDLVIVPWSQAVNTTAACGPRVVAASGLTAYSPDLTVQWFDSSSVTACDRPPIPPHALPHLSRVGDRYIAAAEFEPGKVYAPGGCVDYSICVPVASAVTTSGTWVPSAGSWTSRNGSQLRNVDATGATLRWSSTGSDPRAAVTADPAVDDARAFAPSGTDDDARLAVYPVAGCGQALCGPAWTVTLPAVASFRPAIAGDLVMVATSSGHLVLTDRRGCGASTCGPLRTLDLAGTPTAAPSMVNHRILVPTTAGVETFTLTG